MLDTPSLRILVVDDDPKFCKFAVQGLSESGHTARDADGVAAARRALEAEHFDVVLLDVMMPEADGRELLAELRRAGDDIPVIFVTARGTTDERVAGLRLGADDYVVKPFSFAELLARVESVARRRRPATTLTMGPLTLDVARRIVECHGKSVDLSPKELDLLHALLTSRGRTLSRATLLADVWGVHHDPGTNVVDVFIGRLRRKLQAVDGPQIETQRGEGYRMRVTDG